jgi:HSP20 family protein
MRGKGGIIMSYLLPFRRRNRDAGSELWDSVSDFFSDNFFAPVHSGIHQFRTDIKDAGDHYVIEAELAGIHKDDIRVEYDHNYLSITAKRETVVKDEKENFIRQERHYGEFNRHFYVDDIDEKLIEATFSEGILTLKCPKRTITTESRKRIEIN